ncbi:hypothetical protein DVH24_008562 [Malus domestica]|uniref:Uncharacterized protein n=1 Tax=Malus domestica TaxID=3750 RepID=A0A498JR43_MALDO|nr:hypothetical protein DVH24_008562 [Malus domestica]
MDMAIRYDMTYRDEKSLKIVQFAQSLTIGMICAPGGNGSHNSGCKGYIVKWGRAVWLKCVYCFEIGTLMLADCPDFKKLLEEMEACALAPLFAR